MSVTGVGHCRELVVVAGGNDGLRLIDVNIVLMGESEDARKKCPYSTLELLDKCRQVLGLS
jgi:hypothetical protein